MPLFRRSRNQRGSDECVEASTFIFPPTHEDAWSSRKSLDARSIGKKRRPRLFTLGNDDRPKTASGSETTVVGSNASQARPRKFSWAPPPLPKDDIPSLVGSEADSGSVRQVPFAPDYTVIGMALGSPTEMDAPPMPYRAPPPLPSPRTRAATMPQHVKQREVENEQDVRQGEIKRWKTVSRLFSSKKHRPSKEEPEIARPSTSGANSDVSRTKSRRSRWSRKSGAHNYFDHVDAPEPMPQLFAASRSTSGAEVYEMPPKSSTSLDVSIPNAQLGRYSALFAEALGASVSIDNSKTSKAQIDEAPIRQSILTRRQTGIDSLTIMSPSAPSHPVANSDYKAFHMPRAGIQRSVTATQKIPVILPTIAINESRSRSQADLSIASRTVRRSRSAGEFLSLGTKVLSTLSKEMPAPAQSFGTPTPRTPPLEAFFTNKSCPSKTPRTSVYATPQEQWQESDDSEDESIKHKSTILDDSYAYLMAPGGLSHHSDISSALLSFAHKEGQLSLDTTSQTIGSHDQSHNLLLPEQDASNAHSAGLLSPSYAPLTSPLPNSPLSFLSARSSPSRTGGGATPRLMRHGYDTPTTPCVATAQEMCVTSVRTARNYGRSTAGHDEQPAVPPPSSWDHSYISEPNSSTNSSENSPTLSTGFDDYSSESEDHGEDGPDSEEAIVSLARSARVITPDNDRHSFRASLNEHAIRDSVADPFAAQEYLWREVGECWGVRGSRLGLGLEAAS